MLPEPVFSPKQLAQAIGVSESSVKRWADDGVLAATRTAGGHRRIALAEAVRFIRAQRLTVQQPELLGLRDLQQARGLPTVGDESANEALFEALFGGETARARGMLMGWYLAGQGVATLCDGPVRYAMDRLGQLWRHEDHGIFHEHRATDACLQALNLLRWMQPSPPAGAPVALGCNCAQDTHLLASVMAAATLAEQGWQTVNLGMDTPLGTLMHAVGEHRPRLVWVACSFLPEEGTPLLSREQLGQLAAAAHAAGGALVLGGRGLDARMVPDAPHVLLAGSMSELAAFARALTLSRPGGGG